MRVLFTVQPGVGHLHPLVPVAQALSDAGHDVIVCSAASFGSDIERFGLRPAAAGVDWLMSDRSTWQAFPPAPPPGPEFAKYTVTVFARIAATHMADDLLSIARSWKPDLIVRDGMEYGGCLVAECLDIPHASIACVATAAIDSPTLRLFPGNRQLVAEPLAHLRKRYGLPPDADTDMPYRHLHLAFMPPSWDGHSAPRPPNIRFARHTSVNPPEAEWPTQTSGLPEPMVIASLGTVFHHTPGVLDAVVTALAGVNVPAIVAIGDRDPASFGPLPHHLHLAASIPQSLLLPRSALLVTHGGFNSVKEALSVGVPMVVVPIAADQFYSAERSAEIGVAVAVGTAGDPLSADAIYSATRRVLTEPHFRANAQAFQAEMMALPGTDEVVAMLEGLARDP